MAHVKIDSTVGFLWFGQFNYVIIQTKYRKSISPAVLHILTQPGNKPWGVLLSSKYINTEL